MQDQIESDLSVFHRIDDMWSMDSRRFVRLALLLAAYAGAVQAALLAERERNRQAQDAPPPPVPGSVGPGTGGVVQRDSWAGTLDNPHEVVLPRQYEGRHDVTVVPSNRTALMASDLGQLLSFGYG